MRILAIFTGLLVLMVVAVGMAMASPATDAEKGKELWAASLCQRCHGANGEGFWAGPRAGDGLPADRWINQARNPRANMPMFSPAQVSDQDITDMNEFMQTLPKPASFTRTTFPTQPGDHPGKVLVAEKGCAVCHTETGPVGPFQSTGRTPTAEAVITQLRTPKNRMPSFRESQVSDEQAAQIAEFVASQVQAAPAAQPTAAPAAQPTAAPAAQPTAAPATSLPRTGGLPVPFFTASALAAALAAAGLVLRRRS